jgi:hypothetical protein
MPGEFSEEPVQLDWTAAVEPVRTKQILAPQLDSGLRSILFLTESNAQQKRIELWFRTKTILAAADPGLGGAGA